MAAVVRVFDETVPTQCSIINQPRDTAPTCTHRTSASCHLSYQSESFKPLSFPQSNTACLPVSKGCIKKTAQTRFVNSSPRSYRLMPASVESSDKTSFVEKWPHNHYLPMKFMLEVAELWEVSKRSELECNFTLAKSEKLVGSEHFIKEAKQRSPICHSAVLPSLARQAKRSRRRNLDIVEEINKAGLGRDLFSQVKTFLKAQELKERHPMGIAGLMKMECYPSKNTRCESFVETVLPRSDVITISDDDSDFSSRGSFSLTPLVKRLSVTGVDETANIEGENVSDEHASTITSERNGTVKKSPVSTKRPKSKRVNDQDEEPLQKRAYCSRNQIERAIEPR